MDQILGPPRNMLLQGMASERQSSDIQVFGGLKVEIRARRTLARGDELAGFESMHAPRSS